MSGLYRDHHLEQMHSNGTTAYKTVAAILPSYLITFITVLFDTILYTYITKQKKWQFVMEYITLVLPIIFSITILSKYLENILVILVVIVVSCILLICNIRSSKSIINCNRSDTNFLTNARSTINILSVIAILAVDFDVFPRYFTKTESFGYSLMDVGVGLFIYSNGIVAPETKGRKDPVKKSIKASIPLFILGAARFIFVKQTDYIVPISEYGVHWNFFITLGFTKIVCAFILNVAKIRYILINASFVIIFHEILLQLGLQNFTFMKLNRDNFFTANKEGLVSILGYVSIYLFSVYFGYCLRIKNQAKNKTSTTLAFITYSLLALVISIILQNYFGISRKLANSAYCFWVLFIGIFMTGLYYLSQLLLEFICRGKLQAIYSPLIFESVNYNGLVFFLIGNVLTGLINITFNTLSISNPLSLAILTLYMFINCLIVTILYYMQYKLKF